MPFYIKAAMTAWILLIGLPLILGLIAQMRVSSAFNHWKSVPVSSGVTGAQAAQMILRAAGIRDVEVVPIRDMLGDHYDPYNKRLCLSPEVYNTASVAAVGIAAHEVGHAIQDAKKYAPLQARMALVPITMFASQLLWPIFIASAFFQISQLMTLALICFVVLTIFQLITLPVEFDASRRAKIILSQMGMVRSGMEAQGVNSVLNAAALTYVAAFIASLGNLIYFLLSRRE
ncbi:MAG: zinc metallopeptidase [Chthoniobacterales bacterium]|nr:zinc metallopeptidase [Chthoniobacterales bacterium]MCX7713640.1 zinc metallopeptidase [Chthoniobacterales bacterium]